MSDIKTVQALKADALEIFAGCSQETRDAIEWYDASVTALIEQMQREEAQPVAQLVRWEPHQLGSGIVMRRDGDGEWVEFADVQQLLAAPSHSSKAALSDEEIDAVARDGEGDLPVLAALIGTITKATANGEALAALMSYRKKTRLSAARAILARAGIEESRREPLTRHEFHLALDRAGIAGDLTFDRELAIARVVEAWHGITPQAGRESGDA